MNYVGGRQSKHLPPPVPPLLLPAHFLNCLPHPAPSLPASFPFPTLILLGFHPLSPSTAMASAVVILNHKCYTVKNFMFFENKMHQCCGENIVQSCQQYCSALLHLIAGWFRLINIVQYCWQPRTVLPSWHCCILVLKNLGTKFFFM